MSGTGSRRSRTAKRRKLMSLWLLMLLRKLQLARRKFWVHPILKKRKQHGEFHRLVSELRLDETRFRQYFRMGVEIYDCILVKTDPVISMQDTNYRQSISSNERLALCLRYLATGNSFRSLAFNFRLGVSTVRAIVIETCQAIWTVFKEEFMPRPTYSDWMQIAGRFEENWDFSHCIGTLDGKHVVIQAPPNSGSTFSNYIRQFSIVFQAVVDAEYKFRIVDIGAYGRESDGGIFATSELGQGLDIPSDRSFGGNLAEPLPFVIVADEAFPLKTYLMRPFPGRNLTFTQKVFNYRLSRARRVVENAFGILAQRWRIYQRRIIIKPQYVDHVIQATCLMHNIIQCSSDGSQVNMDNEANNSEGLQGVSQLGGNRSGAEAVSVMGKFSNYFCSVNGELPWQGEIVTAV